PIESISSRKTEQSAHLMTSSLFLFNLKKPLTRERLVNSSNPTRKTQTLLVVLNTNEETHTLAQTKNDLSEIVSQRRRALFLADQNLALNQRLEIPAIRFASFQKNRRVRAIANLDERLQSRHSFLS